MQTESSANAIKRWLKSAVTLINFPDKQLQNALNRATWASLRPAALGIGVIFILLVIIRLALKEYISLPQMVYDLVAAVVLLAAAYLLGRLRPNYRLAPVIGAAIILFVALANLFQIWLTQSIYQTAFIIVIIVGSAVFILSPLWLSLVWVATWAGWLAVVLRFPSPQPLLTPFVFTLLIATVVGCIIYFQRVADVRQTEQDQLELRKLTVAVEQSPITVVITDLEGNIAYVNKCFTQTTGYSPEEAIGKNPRILKSGKTPPETYDQLWNALTSGQIWRGEFVNRKKDGTEYYELANISPITNADGVITHYLAMKEDISELRRIRQNILYQRDLARALAGTTSIHAALKLCLDRTLEAAELDCGGIYLVDRLTHDLDLVVSTNLSAEFLKNVAHIPAGNPLWHLLITAKPVYTLYEQIPAPKMPALENEGLRAIGIIPVIHQGQMLACFNLASHCEDDISKEKRETIEQITMQIGNALVRIQAQEELQESEKRYRLISENAGDVIWILDLNTQRLLYVSPSVEKLRGYTPEEVMTQNFSEAMTSASLKHMTEALPPRLSAFLQDHDTKKIYTDEVVQFHKDGHEIPTEVTSSFFSDETEGIKLMGASRDITERLRARNALEKSERRFRALLENSTDAVSILNEKSVIIYESPNFYKVTGFTPEERLGKGAFENIQPEDLPLALSTMQRLLTTPFRQETIEMRLKKKDGTLYWGEITATNLLQQPDVEGIVLNFRDITQRKNAEAEVAAANEALIVARDEALQASRLKSEFLATMSHELRTPLNAIIGLTGLLLDTVLTERQQEYLEIIRRSSENLLFIINDILDFSKIEAGKLEIEEQPFNVELCVSNAIEIFHPATVIKKLRMTCEIVKSVPPRLNGDMTRLQQMLVNLLSNAVKFTEHGEISLKVDALPLNEADHPEEGLVELHFSVKDTGIGMKPEQLKRLFQPFTQGDISTSRQYGGSGLGLVITKRLAEMMGGSVWAESAAGHGSTFHFTVRMKKAFSPAEGSADEIGTEISPQNLELLKNLGTSHPLRILLAEDSPVNQKVALYMLEYMGYRADLAANGHEVLAALKRQPYDVILMDVQMPEMDGVEAAGRIRDLYPPDKRPHIIAMTAFALPGDRDRFLASGMDDYVSKPVRQNELANLLRTISPLVLQAGMVVGGPEEKPKRAINPVKIEPAGPALDPDALAALQESLGDRYTAEFEEISAIFIEYATPLLAKLHEAVDHQDGEALFSNAHALKSSSGNIAALRLAGLCSELEALSRSSQLSGTSAKLAELELEFDRVKAALELKKMDT